MDEILVDFGEGPMNIASTYTLCKTKIKRNEEMISLLELDNKICKLELVLCYRKMTNNVKRIEKINEINDIERKQMYEIGDRVKALNESLPNTIFIGPEKPIAVQEHEKRCIP